MNKISRIRRGKMLSQGGRCYYCNLPMWDPTIATMGHPPNELKHLSKALRRTAEHLHPRTEGGNG